MERSSLEIVSFVSTYLVLGMVGYLSAKSFKKPVSAYTWVLVIIATILAAFVGIGGSLISIFGFKVYLNWCLQAFGIGLIIGLLNQLIKSRLARKSEV